MNAKDLLARIQLHKEQTAAIQALWASLFPEFPEPEARQCQVWLKFYTFDQIIEGLDVALTRCATREHNETLPDGQRKMDRDDILAYASGAMKKVKLGIGKSESELSDDSNMGFKAECVCDDKRPCTCGVR